MSWTDKKFLKLNNSKTQAMIIGSCTKLKHLDAPTPVTVNGASIKYVKQYSYLGILLDEEMTLQPMS